MPSLFIVSAVFLLSVASYYTQTQLKGIRKEPFEGLA